jgi:hypothetical protein
MWVARVLKRSDGKQTRTLAFGRDASSKKLLTALIALKRALLRVPLVASFIATSPTNITTSPTNITTSPTNITTSPTNITTLPTNITRRLTVLLVMQAGEDVAQVGQLAIQAGGGPGRPDRSG